MQVLIKNTTSQTLPPEITKTIDVIASNINAGQTILFCDAGISRDSGFPVVNELVPYVLLVFYADTEEIPVIESTLKTITNAQQHQEHLIRTIVKRLGAPPESVDKIVKSLPFEALVETLRSNSKINK